MTLKRLFAVLLVVFIVAGLFAGCAKQEKSKNKTGKTEYEDGIYFAQEDTFAENGWKNVVTLRVADGKIVEADWNGANKKGGPDKKTYSESGQYGMVARGGASAEWHEQAKLAEDYLIETQDPDAITYKDDEGHTDDISGATIHVKEFFTLAKKALAEGPVGKGPYKDGNYRAEAAEFDEKSGWKSYVDMTIINGRIVACYWSGIHKDGGDDKYTQSVNGEYEMKEKGNASSEWHEQADKVVDYLLKNQSLEGLTLNDEGKTDAISGATISIKDFYDLVSQCLEQAKEE